MLRSAFLLPLIVVLLQGQIHTPQAGFIRCADGTVKAVYGVPGAFVLGRPILGSVVSSSFSEQGGIVATRDAIRVLDAIGNPVAEFSSADSGALVDMETGASSAIAWLPASLSLLSWDGKAFHETQMGAPVAGQVIAVRLAQGAAVLTVLDQDAVSEQTIALNSGYLLSVHFLAGVHAPVMQVGTSIVFRGERALEIDGPAGHQSLDFPLQEIRLERMSSRWIHILSTNSRRHWALHVTARGDSELCELPALERVR